MPMSKTPSPSVIAEFWEWFRGIADELSKDLRNKRVHADLDQHVSRLGDVLWEIGPGVSKKNALVITPDGDRNWLPVTKRIVEVAPSLKHWEFHASRPIKDWELRFSLSTPRGDVGVDANAWRYVLSRYPDGMFDIVLEQPSMNAASKKLRYTAATVVLDGLLGEEVRLETIASIETTVALSAKMAKTASSVRDLRSHLQGLASE